MTLAEAIKGHYSCPYSDEDLDYWDGVSTPMGEACNDCLNYECEHNPNPNPCDIFVGETEE